MLKTTIYFALILLASACSKQADLNLEQKAKLISEQIINSPSCAVYTAKLKTEDKALGVTALSEAAIDQIYNDATAAHCIKTDI